MKKKAPFTKSSHSKPGGIQRKKSSDSNERFRDKKDRPFPRQRQDASGGFQRKKSSDSNERFSDKKDRPFPRQSQDASGGFQRKKSSDSNERFSDKKDRPFPRQGQDASGGFQRKKTSDSNERFSDKKDRAAAPRDRKSGPYRKPSGKPRSESFKSKPVSVPGEFPLNKYIAHCGICSRRKAVDFIKEGVVTVNGTAVTEPGYKVADHDVIKLKGKKLSVQREQVYILLNKPKGFLTTTDDPEGRKTVMELVTNATQDRIFPVGRLDRNTSGLLLLTNDGDLAQRLAHPKNNMKKVYHTELDKPLAKADFDKILQGVTLEDGEAHVDSLAYVDVKDKTQIGLEIHSGRNRIVRRIFEHLGYQVEKLDRVFYAGLTKKNLPRGKWRMLSEKEVILLKHFKN